MPPKKLAEPEIKPLIGRIGTNLRIGIVGVPNVGKSTFFNVLTKSAAPAENFPFCTIDPNENRVPVPDSRYDYLCEYHKPASKVPAYLNVVDIAGLVKGAAEGQGLGNAFLSHISACDAIFHLCRAFEDSDVTHVEGEVDPVRDLSIISEELRLKDEEKLLTNLDKLEKLVTRGGDKKSKPEYETLLKIKEVLTEEKKHIRFADWSAHDIEVLNKYLFLTSKPCIYLVNLSDKDFIRKKNKWLPKIKEWIDKNDPGAPIIPFSGAFEHQLAELETDADRKAYEEEHKCVSVLDKIITTGYKALQLEYFFTAGPDEVKAWTIQKGTKAPQAAGRIHTDFEKGFIMAEVMHFGDFKEEGSESGAKAAGKYRQQGRNYVVEDGDIIFFKFNAGAGLKDAKKK
ncbi:obg-like ATPase 1 [Anopheles nili]|uniref:obg-like ATPase 1 n=1 Tax=Anopheles nili TaxID=185578 RepID=UPI00237C0116|nr:obg-like ATPase 1 [Anopheles nili]